MVGGGVGPQEGTSHPLVPPRCSHLPPGSCSRNVLLHRCAGCGAGAGRGGASLPASPPGAGTGRCVIASPAALWHPGPPAGGGGAAGGGTGAKRSVRSRTSHGEGEGCGRLPAGAASCLPPCASASAARGAAGTARGGQAGTAPRGAQDAAPQPRGAGPQGVQAAVCPVLYTPALHLISGVYCLPGRKLLSISHVCTQEEKAVFNLQVYFCRQLTAAPGTFPCLELNFATA